MAFSSSRGSSSSSSRSGNQRAKASDIYSTVVIHGDDGEASGGAPSDDEEDISKLPPLLQRLPKGFGAHPDDEDDDEDDGDGLGFSGAVIVKRDRPSPPTSARRPLRSPFTDAKRASPRSRAGLEEAYSTFVRRSTPRSRESTTPREDWDSGTLVRRTGSGGGYGRVFKSHILGRPIVVSTDVEVNRAVLQNQERFVPCYPRSVRELLGESSILEKEGSIHRRIHGLIGGFVKSQAAKTRVADAIERAVLRSLARWQQGQLVFVQDEAKAITFQALLKVLLGIEPGKDLDFLKREYSEFIRGLICLPIKLPGTRLYKSLKAKEKVLKLLRKIVEERIQKGRRSSVKDVLDVLLNETETHEQQQLLIDPICENITELMVPGEHSVPVLVTIAVKYLSDFPLVLEQLRVENMNLKREKIKLGEPYAWTDYMSLTFTQHVINETLRMGNIVNGVWRKAVKDTEIKGYLFPKGWGVLTSFSSIHLDEEIYPDPYDFNPWRWENKAINTSNFTPFGGGQRLCPGQDLTRIEIAIFLHHLVTNYSWVAEEDSIVHFPTVQLKRKMPIRISATSIRHD